MEPQRPLVDRKVLEFVQAHTFHPADFTIRSDGVCRLNPEMVRHVVSVTAQGGQISPTRTVLAGPHRVRLMGRTGRASASPSIARHSRF